MGMQGREGSSKRHGTKDTAYGGASSMRHGDSSRVGGSSALSPSTGASPSSKIRAAGRGGLNQRLPAIIVVALTLQVASVFVLIRVARASGSFSSSSAVFSGECIKLVIACAGVALEAGSVGRGLVVLRHAFAQPMELAKIAVPGVLYLFQNNLLYVASTYLDAPMTTILLQLKVLTTAVFSVLFLGRKLEFLQWLSLPILIAGVILVQLTLLPNETQDGSPSTAGGGEQGTPDWFDFAEMHGTYIGIAAVITSSVFSGFSSVYFEAMLKNRPKGVPTSVWVLNVQLALYGVGFGLISAAMKPSPGGMFAGFTPVVWASVIDMSIGGVLVALTVKHTNAVVKNLATTIAIVLSSVISVVFFDSPLCRQFVVGAALVVSAVLLYGYAAARKNQEAKSAPPPSTKLKPSVLHKKAQ